VACLWVQRRTRRFVCLCLGTQRRARFLCSLVIGYHVIGPSLAATVCVCDLRLRIFIEDPTASSLAISMLVSVDTCVMSVGIMSHSPFLCLLVTDITQSAHHPAARFALDLRLRIFITDPTASSLPACSYPSIHVACLLASSFSYSPYYLLVIGYHAIGPSLERLVISGRIYAWRTQQTPACQHARISQYIWHFTCDWVSRYRPITDTACF
jgi:hypothetical protein